MIPIDDKHTETTPIQDTYNILTSELVFKSIKRAIDWKVTHIKYDIERYGEFDTKRYSEDISKYFAQELVIALDDIENVVAPRACGKSDLEIYGVPVEIKTTTSDKIWLGGEFSDRSGIFILVGLDIDHETGEVDDVYVAKVFLKKSDWTCSHSSFYGTSFTTKQLFGLINEEIGESLVGKLIDDKYEGGYTKSVLPIITMEYEYIYGN